MKPHAENERRTRKRGNASDVQGTRFSLFPKRSHFGANKSENKWETGKERSTQGNQG